MKKINKWGMMKQMTKAAMFITLLFLGMQFGVMYADHRNEFPGHSFIDFITYEERFEWGHYEEVPAEVQKKLENMTDFSNIAKSILVMFIFFEIFSYLEKPEEHWVQVIKKWAVKFGKHMEDEDIETDNRDE